MRGVKLPRILLVLAFAASGMSSAHATPPIALETHVVLTIAPLTVERGRSKTAGTPQGMEVGPSQPTAIDLVVPWGTDRATVTVHFSARLISMTPDGEAVLFCESRATLSSRAPVVAAREIRLADEGSSLFEVFGDGERRLVLTVQGEQVARAVVRPLVSVGAPVRFVIAVERVDGERIVLLETNELHSFVGQSVEYSFRQGQDEGLESVRLTVLPVAVSGNLVTIEAEINGALPGAGGTVLVSHSERIVASRLATSRLAATTGTPPAGYRFQVTPDF